MAKSVGGGGIDTSKLDGIKAIGDALLKITKQKNKINIDDSDLDKAKKKEEDLTKAISEQNKTIGKAGQIHYFATQEEMVRQLTQAWISLSKAQSEYEKGKQKGKITNWANAYRAMGYDEKKLDQDIFRTADEHYASHSGKKANGDEYNSLSSYSIDAFKEVFGQALDAGIDINAATKHWAQRNKGKISQAVLEETKKQLGEIKPGSVEIPMDEILDVQIGQGKNRTLRNKIDRVKQTVTDLYSKVFDESGNETGKDLGSAQTEKYIQSFLQWEAFLNKMGETIPAKYKKLFDEINGHTNMGKAAIDSLKKQTADPFAIAEEQFEKAQEAVKRARRKSEREGKEYQPLARQEAEPSSTGKKAAQMAKEAAGALGEQAKAQKQVNAAQQEGKSSESGSTTAEGSKKATDALKEQTKAQKAVNEQEKENSGQNGNPAETRAKTIREQYEEALSTFQELGRQSEELDKKLRNVGNAYTKAKAAKDAFDRSPLDFGEGTRLATGEDFTRVINDTLSDKTKSKSEKFDKIAAFWGLGKEKGLRVTDLSRSGKNVNDEYKKRYDEMKQENASGKFEQEVDEIRRQLREVNEKKYQLEQMINNLRRQLALEESKPTPTQEETPSWQNGLNDKEIKAVEAYIKRMKALQKEAYDESQALSQALSKFNAIKNGDVESIIATATSKDTPTSRMLAEMTGMPVNNKDARNAALRSINPEKFDEIIRQQTADAQAELDKQKSSFKEKWAEVAEAMLGGDVFADHKPIEKGQVLKELERYADTAKDAIDEINKQWLSGTVDESKFSGRWTKQYISALNDAKEDADIKRQARVGELDPDSLFRQGNTTALTQEQVDALHAEAAAYDELIAKKREYYQIEDPKTAIRAAYDELYKAENFIKDRVNQQMTPPALERAETPQAGLEELETYRDNLQGLLDGVGQTNERLKRELTETVEYFNRLIETQRKMVEMDNREKGLRVFEEDADALFSNFDLDKSKSEYENLFSSVESGAMTAERALTELGKAFDMVYDSANRDWSVNPQKIADEQVQMKAGSLRKGEDGTYITSDKMYTATRAKGGYDVRSMVDGLQTHVKTLAEAKEAISKMINDSFSSVEQKINQDLSAGVIDAEQAANRLASVKVFVLETYGDLTSALGSENGEFLINQISSGKLSYANAFNLYDSGTVKQYREQIEQVERIRSDIQELLSQGTGTRGQGEFQIDVLTGFLDSLSTSLGFTETEVQKLKEEIQSHIDNIKQTMNDLDKESPSGFKFTPKPKQDVKSEPKPEETDPIKRELQSQIDFVKSDIERTKRAILAEDPDGILNSIFYGNDGRLKSVDFEHELNLERTRQELYGDPMIAEQLSSLPNTLIELYEQLYENQVQLDIIQKDGLSYLQEEADIRKEIASVKETDIDQQLDAHTLQISDEDASTKLSVMEQAVEKIDAIRSRIKALTDAQPIPYIADVDDLNAQLNGLDEIRSKLEANIEVLRMYKEVQRDDQYNIWMDFSDKFSDYDFGDGEKELSRLRSTIDERAYAGDFASGQDAIDEFIRKAKELGFVLDETGSKWVKLNDSIQQQETPPDQTEQFRESEEQATSAIDRNNQSLKERIEYLKQIKSESKFMEDAEDRKMSWEEKGWDVDKEEQFEKLVDHINRANEALDEFDDNYDHVLVKMKDGSEIILRSSADLDDFNSRKLSEHSIADVQFFPFSDMEEEVDHFEEAKRKYDALIDDIYKVNSESLKPNRQLSSVEQANQEIAKLEEAISKVKEYRDEYNNIDYSQPGYDENAFDGLLSDLDSVEQKLENIKKNFESQRVVLDTKKRQGWEVDAHSLSDFDVANSDFVKDLYSQVIAGTKMYDQAMDELKEHIASRSVEVRAQQERQAKSGQELTIFTENAKQLFQTAGLAEGEAPKEYVDLLNQIFLNGLSAASAIKQLGDAMGYAFDEQAGKWSKVQREGTQSKDIIVRSQEEIQAEIEETNGIIKNQEDWMRYLGDPNAAVTSTGKRDATDKLRSATNRLVSYRMRPEQFYGQLDEEKITVGWWKAMQEAQRQGVADSVIARYDTDITESHYEEALAKLQKELTYRIGVLQESKDKLVRLQAELQQAISGGVTNPPPEVPPVVEQMEEEAEKAESAAKRIKEAINISQRKGTKLFYYDSQEAYDKYNLDEAGNYLPDAQVYSDNVMSITHANGVLSADIQETSKRVLTALTHMREALGDQFPDLARFLEIAIEQVEQGEKNLENLAWSNGYENLGLEANENGFYIWMHALAEDGKKANDEINNIFNQMDIPTQFGVLEEKIIQSVTHMRLSVEDGAKMMKNALDEFADVPEKANEQLTKMGELSRQMPSIHMLNDNWFKSRSTMDSSDVSDELERQLRDRNKLLEIQKELQGMSGFADPFTYQAITQNVDEKLSSVDGIIDKLQKYKDATDFFSGIWNDTELLKHAKAAEDNCIVDNYSRLFYAIAEKIRDGVSTIEEAKQELYEKLKFDPIQTNLNAFIKAMPDFEDGVSVKTFDDTRKKYEELIDAIKYDSKSAEDAIKEMLQAIEDAARINNDPYGLTPSNISTPKQMTSFLDFIDVTKLSLEDIQIIMQKIGEFGGFEKLALSSSEKMNQLIERMHELYIEQQKISDGQSYFQEPSGQLAFFDDIKEGAGEAKEKLNEVKDSIGEIEGQMSLFGEGRWEPGGIYWNQTNRVGDDSWSYVERLGYHQTQTVQNGIDEEGNPYTNTTLHTDFKALLTDIMQTDTSILKLQEDIRKLGENGVRTDRLQENLGLLQIRRGNLQAEMERYYTSPEYIPGDRHRDFYDQRIQENIQTVQNRIAQYQEVDDAGYAKFIFDMEKRLQQLNNMEQQFQNIGFDYEDIFTNIRDRLIAITPQDTIGLQTLASQINLIGQALSDAKTQDSNVQSLVSSYRKLANLQDAAERAGTQDAFDAVMEEKSRRANIARRINFNQLSDQERTQLAEARQRYRARRDDTANAALNNQELMNPTPQEVREQNRLVQELIDSYKQLADAQDRAAKSGEIKDRQNVERIRNRREEILQQINFHRLTPQQQERLSTERGFYRARRDDAANRELNAQIEAERAQQDASARSAAREREQELKRIQEAYNEILKTFDRLGKAETQAINTQGLQAGVKALEQAKEAADAASDAYLRLIEMWDNGQITDDQFSEAYDRLQAESVTDLDTWDALISKAQQYENIRYKKESGGRLTVRELSFLQQYEKLYEEIGKSAAVAGEKGKEFLNAVSGAQTNIRDSILSSYESKLGDLAAPGQNQTAEYNEQIEILMGNLERLHNTEFGSEQWRNAIRQLDADFNKLNSDMAMQPVDENARASLNRQMSEWIAKNGRAGEYAEQVKQLQSELANVSNKGDQQRIAQGFDQIKAAAAEAGKTGQTFAEGLIKRFKSLGQYLLSFASFYRIIGTLKRAFNIVKELDTGLMEVRKVSSESLSSLKEWQKTTFDQANTVGGTASQIESSTAAWLRLGKSFTEAQEAAQASVELLNVSEFTSIDDATTSLVSMRQAFEDLTYEDFIDKLNAVGDNYSSSTDKLAQGMQNISAVLKTAGNDIDQSLALLTAAKIVGCVVQKYTSKNIFNCVDCLKAHSTIAGKLRYDGLTMCA